MIMTLMEASQEFIQRNPSIRVGKSKFCSLKPKWIKLTNLHGVCYFSFYILCVTLRKFYPFSLFAKSCACEYHQNPALILSVLNRRTNCCSELSTLIKLMLCENQTTNCYLGKCAGCNTHLPSSFFIEQLKILSINEDNDVTWMMWGKNEKRTELQRHTTSVISLLEKFDSLWPQFLIHHFYTIEQYEKD